MAKREGRENEGKNQGLEGWRREFQKGRRLSGNIGHPLDVVPPSPGPDFHAASSGIASAVRGGGCALGNLVFQKSVVLSE